MYIPFRGNNRLKSAIACNALVKRIDYNIHRGIFFASTVGALGSDNAK
jgi:hypothetical protein